MCECVEDKVLVAALVTNTVVNETSIYYYIMTTKFVHSDYEVGAFGLVHAGGGALRPTSAY